MKCLCERAKGLVSLCGRLVSIVISCFDILIWRGLLPFSGVMFTNCFSVLMSIHSIWNASPLRAPVSLRNWRKVEVILLHPAIRLLSSSSVGMKGIVVIVL